MSARHTRRRSQRGTALVELTWLSILLLVPLVYVVVAVFEVQRAAFGVSAATRAAARAYALAPSDGSGESRARTAAAVALGDQGLSLSRATMSVGCASGPCLTPGSAVQVRLSYPVALPLVPAALGHQTPSIRVESAQAVPYGSFREDRS